MVATVSIYYDTGGSDAAPATETDVDALGPPNLRFKLADNPTIDTNDKLVIPAAGDYYSMWKQIYLYCDNPDGNTLDNLRLYSDETNNFGTGVDLEVGTTSPFPEKTNTSDAGYEVATKTGDSGDEMVANHAGVSAKASIFTYSEASPLNLTISESGGVIDAAGETSDYVVLQMKISSTASPGELPVDEQLTIKYDES